MRRPTSWGDGESYLGGGRCREERNPRNALPHCLGAMGSRIPAMHFHTALGQWVAELVQCTTKMRKGSRQWNSCNALPQCLGEVGNGTRAMHTHSAQGYWAL